MSLSENTSKIEQLLAAVSALPEAGGNSGGLPEHIKKLATGIYRPSSDDGGDFTVTHNFGELPTFLVLFLCDDVGTTAQAGTRVFQFQTTKKMVASNGTLNLMRGAQVYYGSSGTVSTGGLSDANSAYATTATATFKGSATYKLKAGLTYRWVVCVLDDVL